MRGAKYEMLPAYWRKLLGVYRDEATWPQVHEAMIDAMTRLERAVKPHIKKLRA
jgi:hypothetical protein